MNIDEVLLTDGEQSQAIQQADGWIASLNTPYGRRFLEDIGDNLAKAQALKLLEWLKEPCKEHDYCHRDWDDKGTAIDVDVERRECPQCMSELESKLKEGR
jgi:hypothetical protein